MNLDSYTLKSYIFHIFDCMFISPSNQPSTILYLTRHMITSYVNFMQDRKLFSLLSGVNSPTSKIMYKLNLLNHQVRLISINQRCSRLVNGDYARKPSIAPVSRRSRV